jgi:RNA polymerase sigma-70 factor (ECF subfamily)
MKSWLSRAVARTVVRGEDRRNRVARWSSWFPVSRAVDGSRFQGVDDPFPRHWREFPESWPPIDPNDQVLKRRLLDAIDELPSTWRDVVLQRDVRGRSSAEVSSALGITPGQERAMLNRARAFLRERLAQFLADGGHRR